MKIVKSSLMVLALLPSLNSWSSNIDGTLEERAPKSPEEEKSVTQYERVTWLDKMMSTVSKDLVLDGPIFRNTEIGRNEYGSAMVKILLNEAHKKAARYLKYEDTKAYYAFMTLALTVPMHEGLYMQYREVNDSKGLCNQHANSGNILFAYTEEKLNNKYTPEELAAKKLSSTTFKNFTKYLKTGDTPFFPNCDAVANDEVVRQIVRGGDGSDISMMQLSIRWHSEDFLANQKYLSMEKTFDYGLGYLMKGFKSAYTNKKKYKCITKGFFKKRVVYDKLIRGTWAGHYNSGQVRKTCRFDENGAYAAHDKGFKTNLEKVLDYDSQDWIGYNEGLSFKLDTEVMAAVQEIVKNHKDKTNNRAALEKILK